MLTIVIPARNELYLTQTVDDIFANAAGEIEVIIALDDCWNLPLPADRPNLTILHWGGRRGMRAGINAAAAIGKGKYLMKVDAHCKFSQGFDEVLKKDCAEDWIVIPRRYALDAEAWEVKTDRPVYDYMYLAYPAIDENNQLGLHGQNWPERGKERRGREFDIDETMSFQGSCWFTRMDYFKRLVYPMDEAGYGMFIGEPNEIGLKAWLSGGRVMVNKHCWYAHLWKGQQYRELHLQRMGFPYTRVGRQERKRGNAYNLDFWFNNRWTERKHDLAWLVDRFAPVPTWPAERELWTTLPKY